MRGLFHLTFAATLTVLTACDEAGPRTQVTYVGTYGSLRALGAEARAGRAVPVHAVNNPYGNDAALANTFAEHLSQRDQSLRFEGAGGGLPDAGAPRVLVLVDTPTDYTGISACQGKPYEAQRREERIIVRMMVCDEAQRLVEVMGVLPRETASLESAFDQLLEQGAGELIVGEDRSPK
ncbi:MAG: hypothetical protein R8L07_17935 [Alphaproteobacteria bacterium]|nr:hypothetical protein [Alphaproteobacteria bacterium]